jgi:hypothetical protein
VRSRPDRAVPLLVLLLWTAVAAAAQPDAAPPASTLRHDDIEQAVETLEADPNLGIERKMRTLRFIDDEEAGRREQPGWARWLADMFGWLASSARLLVWVACGLLAAMVAVLLVRLVRGHSRDRALAGEAAPTHVRDLDIRPESLPEDIGATARQLWDAGEARRALALLYRGLLSKLAHDHRAPVRESTTEGDCVGLALRFLPAGGSAFATRLVNTWSQAVYGSLMPATAEVHALCDGFAPAVLAAPESAAAP